MSGKFFIMLFTFLALIIFGGQAIAQSAASEPAWTQTVDKMDYYHTTTVAVDSSDTTFSTAFHLATYNNADWISCPWSLEVAASSASLKAVNYLQGSFYKTTLFANVDTVISSDSTYTNKRIYIDANNLKYPYYRWMSVNVKGVHGTSYIRYNLYNVKKE
jgi:hypothetical protein